MSDRPPTGLRKVRLALWALTAVVLAAAGLMLALHDTQPAPAARDYGSGIGGPFEMVASDGSTVTDQTFTGKPFAIFFGFTRCPDVCPTTLARMARLRQQLGDDGGKFSILFVSVDRERDTPKDIGSYVDLFGTPIVGLTGSADQLARIVKEYHVYYEKIPQPGGDYTIDHTAAVYLMDRAGKLQSIIDHQESDASALAKLKRLIA